MSSKACGSRPTLAMSWVSFHRAGIQGYLADWETHEYDAVTGEHITLGLFHASQVLAMPDGSLLAANERARSRHLMTSCSAGMSGRFPVPGRQSRPSS